MMLAAYLTTAFVVGAVGAWHLLKNNRSEAAKVMFSMAMWMAALVAPVQLVAGDMHGLNTLEYQPAKIAAIEGHFEGQREAPLLLFGIPDMETGETYYKVEIPKLGSLILTHSLDGRVPGLKDFPRDDWPNATIIFFSFRVMVGIGFLMVGLGLLSLWARWRGTLYESVLLHRLALAMGPAGFIAVLAGWITTEVGRQPFTVYGLLRTADSISPVDSSAVGTSLAVFVVVYFIVFGIGLRYILKAMKATPDEGRGPESGQPTRTAGTTPAPAFAEPATSPNRPPAE
jgi:cytochrome d ubiquinol oxidase subunit I